MKKFKFRLSKVLRVRQVRERIRETELGRARASLAREREAESILLRKIDENSHELGRKLAQRFSAVDAMMYERHIEALKADAAVQAERVCDAQTEVEKSKAHLLRARQQRKALDRLHEKHRQQYIQNLFAYEQKVLDDIKKHERR